MTFAAPTVGVYGVLLFAEAPGEDGLGPLQPVPPRKPGTMGGGARPKFEVNYSSDVDWSQRHEKGERPIRRACALTRTLQSWRSPRRQ